MSLTGTAASWFLGTARRWHFRFRAGGGGIHGRMERTGGLASQSRRDPATRRLGEGVEVQTCGARWPPPRPPPGLPVAQSQLPVLRPPSTAPKIASCGGKGRDSSWLPWPPWFSWLSWPSWYLAPKHCDSVLDCAWCAATHGEQPSFKLGGCKSHATGPHALACPLSIESGM